MLEQELNSEAKRTNHRAKAKEIVRAAKTEKKESFPKRNYNGQHWMQRPENKARMLKQVAKMQRGNKAARRNG